MTKETIPEHVLAHMPLTYAAREPLPLGCWNMIAMRILYMGQHLDDRAMYARRIRACIHKIIKQTYANYEYSDAEGYDIAYALPMAYKNESVLPIIEETIAEWKALMAAGGEPSGSDARNLQNMFDRTFDC